MLNWELLNERRLEELDAIVKEIESKQPINSRNYIKLERKTFFNLIKELNERIESNENFGRTHADKTLNVYIYLLSVRYHHRKNSKIDKRLNGAVLKTREEIAIELGWLEKGEDTRNATRLLKICLDALNELGYIKIANFKVGYYNYSIIFPSCVKLE